MPRNWHLEDYQGKYVGIDLKTDEVVVSGDTPQEVVASIRERGLRGVAMMRVASSDEPLFVGPG